ncbi:hypothetical protein Mterra_02118 [Calidithermus terrae]|uniref:Uncharacterized protein n=1 Tax=Calidithermus terrae TaxID=1408545 RepID=A0A399EPE6_9DEIN|nr:hypothetical protein [Calidithermus terrae]RIH84011.1 hypothetical protein Mterra_02118 [Calidithermus terrae]
MANKEHHVSRVRPPKERRLKALGVEALEADEVNPRVRVRLRKPVAALLESMSTKQRGEVFEAGLKALGMGVGNEQE